uniref:Uncharacterized protein n=1 Tax=Arundo donax TaxID=35708 RepID=A0A0A8ZZB3_ARUDO
MNQKAQDPSGPPSSRPGTQHSRATAPPTAISHLSV